MISGSFFRGTTPTHTFSLPFEKEFISDLRITYEQDKQDILTKTLKDVNFVENEVSVILTQEETFKFREKGLVQVQLKIKTVKGQVLNSNIIEMKIEPSLDEEVI